MSTPKISADEQKKLRSKARIELERLEKIQENTKTVQLLDTFKNKFNICETTYKVILKKHQAVKGKKSKERLTLNMMQVPHALKFAGYDFDYQLLNELFGSNSEKGKTVKKLRDAVTHGINDKAAKEIEKRQDELFGYMDNFLNTIKTFDEVAA